MNVDFREQVSEAIGNLKWIEDMCRHAEPTKDEIAEFADMVEQAYVVIRLLIKVGLQPADLWHGDKADALWVKPASEWPHPTLVTKSS